MGNSQIGRIPAIAGPLIKDGQGFSVREKTFRPPASRFLTSAGSERTESNNSPNIFASFTESAGPITVGKASLSGGRLPPLRKIRRKRIKKIANFYDPAH
ncbi:MAG: hypothetical protein C6W57_05130 [Caldibacillus debilis]|nr:MAG: hypothetical protein C6W57_05130 [Caldibacillus debilis]